jgi:hypothetical protein
MSILRRTTRDPTDNEQADKAEFIQDIGTLTTNSSFLLGNSHEKILFSSKIQKASSYDFFVPGYLRNDARESTLRFRMALL